MKRLAPLALALMAVLAGTSTALAVGNKLTNPSVSPLSGSTTTTFTFSVDYIGGAATDVRAVAGSITVTLFLVSGDATNGTWHASRRLPAGSWTFRFEATAAGHPTNPTATAPPVTVTAPTPPPTPRPTATPRPNPTPTPAASPLASPVASATSGASSTQTAGASVSLAPAGSSATNSASSSSPAGGGLGGGAGIDQNLGRILTGGLVAIGLLAVVGFAAIWRDRRRRQEEGPVLAPVESDPIPSADPRPVADWERDFGLEDEPIGTIEYQPPGDAV